MSYPFFPLTRKTTFVYRLFKLKKYKRLHYYVFNTFNKLSSVNNYLKLPRMLSHQRLSFSSLILTILMTS
jgi:hypothetical protein